MSPLEPLKSRIWVAKRFDGKYPDPKKWTAIMRQEVATSLDGDGCLNIRFDKKGNSYNAVFQFRGSSKLPILLAEKYGGTCFHTKSDGSFAWRMDKQSELMSMLKGIKPYVVQKTEQVNVAIKALKILEKKPRGYKPKLAALKLEMHRLNDTTARKAEAVEFWESLEQ